MRRIILVATVALVMAAMMLAMAIPVLAAPQNPDNKSRNSCGKASQQSPFPAQTEDLGDCGFANNPNYPGIPPGT